MHRRFLISVVAAILAGLCMGQGCLGPQPSQSSTKGIKEGVYSGMWSCTDSYTVRDLSGNVLDTYDWPVPDTVFTAEFGPTGEYLNDFKVPVKPGDSDTKLNGPATSTEIIARTFLNDGEQMMESDVRVTFQEPDGSEIVATGTGRFVFTQLEDGSVQFDYVAMTIATQPQTGPFGTGYVSETWACHATLR